jgi:cytochrome c oxidase subunit 2
MSNTFQSIWYPVSQAASDIKDLTWFLIIMSTAVVIITVTLLILAIRRRGFNDKKHFNPGEKFILWSGLFIPTLILIFTLIWSLQSSMKISKINQEESALNIKVTAHQFWWEVEYPDYDIITANEIYVPIGANIKFELSSKDVIHSFWIPNVHGKLDMLPDHKTFITMNIAKAGKYRGQCAEFCGVQHALMAFPLVALEENDFNQWLKKNQNLQKSVDQSIGKEIYHRESCHTCHAIQGTDFKGKAGPDLTRLTSRLTLGAGTIPNNRKNLQAWIKDSQSIKPLNRMPSYKTLSEKDLQHLLDYLGSLK